MSEYEMSEEVRILEQQLEVATEFCRQYQIESKSLSIENKQLKAQLDKIFQMYYNDEVFFVKNGEGFFTDEFHNLLDDFTYERETK